MVGVRLGGFLGLLSVVLRAGAGHYIVDRGTGRSWWRGDLHQRPKADAARSSGSIIGAALVQHMELRPQRTRPCLSPGWEDGWRSRGPCAPKRTGITRATATLVLRLIGIHVRWMR